MHYREAIPFIIEPLLVEASSTYNNWLIKNVFVYLVRGWGLGFTLVHNDGGVVILYIFILLFSLSKTIHIWFRIEIGQ